MNWEVVVFVYLMVIRVVLLVEVGVEGEEVFLIAVLVDFDLVNLKENVFQLYTHQNLHSYLVRETVASY